LQNSLPTLKVSQLFFAYTQWAHPKLLNRDECVSALFNLSANFDHKHSLTSCSTNQNIELKITQVSLSVREKKKERKKEKK
jgi:hypothetical protein